MKRLTVLSMLFIIAIVGGMLWWKNGVSPVNPSNKESAIFVVEKGSGLKEIAGKLETAGLIKNRVIFFLYARLEKLEGKIQAGSFRLSQSMTAEEIARNLTHGTLDIWITVLEGKRSAEIAEILKEKIPTYDSSWPKVLAASEGYLFPDTYLIPKDADIEMVVNQMRRNFDAKYKILDTSNIDLTQEEIVILASLIEREAITDTERPIIAGILINRLNAGMALQVDATIQYTVGYSKEEKNWWRKNLTFEDLKISSPYNTYRNAGLPPTPIANPGVEALNAAANPVDTDYFYYLHDSERNIRYAKTLAEHNENIEKYGL